MEEKRRKTLKVKDENYLDKELDKIYMQEEEEKKKDAPVDQFN